MRILFIGCVESSLVLLKELIKCNYEICGVITKKASKFNSDFVDLVPTCKENYINFCYVDNVNEEKSITFVKECKPDIIYCFGWSQLLKAEILSIPPKGTIGFHPAKLPYNRGRHPIIWALVLGLHETAVSFFKMDLEADTGEIIAQEMIQISDMDDARTLYSKILQVAKVQVIDFTEKIQNGTLQDLNIETVTGNSWRKRSQADGIIDWRMSAKAICNLVRGLTHPYVGAEFMHNGECVKVWKAEEIKNSGKWDNIEYGKILQVVSETEFYIKAYDNIVHVLESSPILLEEGEYL